MFTRSTWGLGAFRESSGECIGSSGRYCAGFRAAVR